MVSVHLRVRRRARGSVAGWCYCPSCLSYTIQNGARLAGGIRRQRNFLRAEVESAIKRRIDCRPISRVGSRGRLDAVAAPPSSAVNITDLCVMGAYRAGENIFGRTHFAGISIIPGVIREEF